MSWGITDIIAIVVALTVLYFTFISARRPAWVQIIVIILLLAGGYWLWFYEPTPPFGTIPGGTAYGGLGVPHMKGSVRF